MTPTMFVVIALVIAVVTIAMVVWKMRSDTGGENYSSMKFSAPGVRPAAEKEGTLFESPPEPPTPVVEAPKPKPAPPPPPPTGSGSGGTTGPSAPPSTAETSSDPGSAPRMTREEADRLLDALGRRERLEYPRTGRRPVADPSAPDW